MKKLLEELEKNQELKEKIEELDKNPESTAKDYIQTAAEFGVELKEEDFKPAGGQGELGDDELDAVAGGGDCVCTFAGGGTGDPGYDGVCACVLGGGGEYEVRANQDEPRCVCVIGGGGLGYWG